MILLLCTCLDGSGDVADGDGVGLNHARGAGTVSAARRRADRPVRRAHGNQAWSVLIAVPRVYPGCAAGNVLGHGRRGRCPRRCHLSPRVHHITASRTTPAHTHPRSSTHIHLHRTQLTLTSPPATLPARFHSAARAPADTLLVPARSPRKTSPSRRPPRSARPLVRPTSFMRTTTPRSPPAKALRAMSRLRCAQSLHCTNAGKRPPAACRSSLPRGRVWPPRHDRLCLPTLLRVACPRHAAMLSV
jgi:hypothetical protein